MRAILAAALIMATNCVSAGTVYYVDIVNTSATSVVSLEVAPAGGTRFHALHLGETPLQEGASTTVAIRKGDEGCLRDFRVGFADGRVQTHRGFDMCNHDSRSVNIDLRG